MLEFATSRQVRTRTLFTIAIADAEASLGVYESAEETQRVTQRLESLRQRHAALTAEWEELVLQLEQQA